MIFCLPLLLLHIRISVPSSPLEIESWTPLNPIRLENEFQKSWNKFRKPILILFSITTLSVKVPGIQGSRERTRRVCACVYICVIHTYIFNYVFLNVYILYIRVVCTWCVSHSVVSDFLLPHGLQPPGSSVHGILQARILEWVAMTPSGDRPNSGIKPKTPALQAESLPSESLGKLI